MRRSVKVAVTSVCVAFLALSASADTLVLRDGGRIDGTVVGLAAKTITFRDLNGVSRRYPTSDVEAVEFPSAERRDARSLSGLRLEAPAGTELMVRTVERIDSRNAGAGQAFSALVERDVMDDSGRVIIPERSSAQLVIRQISDGGTTGSPEMVLDIQSITIEGRRYLTSTTDLSLTSGTGIGKNKRTAETVGGAAVLGTVIGAVVGGGKGAAIGGLVGAAGGAGVQVATRGHDVQVPAETALHFRLDRAITLQADQ